MADSDSETMIPNPETHFLNNSSQTLYTYVVLVCPARRKQDQASRPVVLQSAEDAEWATDALIGLHFGVQTDLGSSLVCRQSSGKGV